MSSEVLPKEAIQEIKKIIDEKIPDIKKFIDKVKKKRYEYLDNTDILTLGVAFAIGLAIGVAISRKR